MELQDLYDLREIADSYVKSIRNQNPEIISAMHNAIATTNLDELNKLFMRIDVDKITFSKIVTVRDNFIEINDKLRSTARELIKFDRDYYDVILFCDEIRIQTDIGVAILDIRSKTEPNENDMLSARLLEDFVAGKFGDMHFREFIDNILISDLEYFGEICKRINYLIEIFSDNEQIKSELSRYLTERLELIKSIRDDVRERRTQMQQEQKPQPSQPSPAVEDAAPPTPTIMDLMLIDDEQKQELFETLQKLIVGNKGKGVALVSLVCVKYGLFKPKPTYKLLTSSFGDIGAKSGYNNYCNKGLQSYSNEEIQGIERHILPFVNGH